MKRILLPAIIVMVVVASLVGLGGWNESGAPRLTIALTERELWLVNAGVPPGDDPGLRLRLEIAHRAEPLDARNWLPEARLRAIGFPLNIPLGDPAVADAYRDLPPRVAWIALEYDGPAWREIARRRAMQQQGELRWPGPQLPSRLVPVDAALDFDQLSAKYPQGHLIIRAVIAVSYLDAEDGGPLVYGWVRETVPSSVAVPRDLRPMLEGLPEREIRPSRGLDDAADLSPRYEVDLAIGRLGLPYVRGLRRLR